MPMFVLNRDYVLRTTKGHSISFKKGQPVFVPPVIERDAAAIGAECVDGEVKMLDDEEVVIELSPEDRREKIISAFRALETRNAREDFTGTGQPAVKAVEKLSGVDTDRTEIAALWDEYKAAE